MFYGVRGLNLAFAAAALKPAMVAGGAGSHRTSSTTAVADHAGLIQKVLQNTCLAILTIVCCAVMWIYMVIAWVLTATFDETTEPFVTEDAAWRPLGWGKMTDRHAAAACLGLSATTVMHSAAFCRLACVSTNTAFADKPKLRDPVGEATPQTAAVEAEAPFTQDLLLLHLVRW